MSCLGHRLLPTSAGLDQCKSGVSWPCRFPPEASLTKDTLNMLFCWVPSFTSSGLFHYSGDYRISLVIGGLLCYSLFMLSLVNIEHYYQIFLSQGLGMGIGAGMIYTPAMAVQAHHWKARRSLAMGFVITGTSLICIFWRDSHFFKDHLLVVSCTPSCSIICSIALSDLRMACEHRLI
jgi:hypothetical protein